MVHIKVGDILGSPPRWQTFRGCGERCPAPRRGKKAARERRSGVPPRRMREETDGQAFGEDRPRRRVLDRARRQPTRSRLGPPAPPRGGPGRPLQPLARRHRGRVRSDVEPAPGELAGQRPAGGGRGGSPQAQRGGRLAGIFGGEGPLGREDRFAVRGAGGGGLGWAALPATHLLRELADL
jgi:hypothetical protein